MLEPAATVADWNPLSFIAEGMREPIVSGLSLGPIAESLAALAGLGASAVLLSWLALRVRLRTG